MRKLYICQSVLQAYSVSKPCSPKSKQRIVDLLTVVWLQLLWCRRQFSCLWKLGVVYKFKCDLCDSDYVGCTRRHLFQRIDEHKHSAIGKHLRDSHNQKNKDPTEQFTILKKCRGKFECLIYEIIFIQERKPKLNTQSDSIKAKLFST